MDSSDAAMVNEQIALAKEGKLKGTYSINQTGALLIALRKASSIMGGRVLVIGSERPWVEACALAVGAESVVTLEYGEINSEHPQIQTITPPQFRAKYADKALGTFDAVISFSSVEHAGLGRYGDALNLWADSITISQAQCVTRQKGAMVYHCGSLGASEDNSPFIRKTLRLLCYFGDTAGPFSGACCSRRWLFRSWPSLPCRCVFALDR